jgi:hypothetical protein
LRTTAAPAIIVAVTHHHFAEMGSGGLREFGKPKHVLFELKYLFGKVYATILGKQKLPLLQGLARKSGC